MSRLYSLEDLNQERNSGIFILNGSDLNCTLYKSLKPRTMTISHLFEYLSVSILILGLIGNSLGLYCAMRDKIIYIRVYLTRVFHAVNLVNYIFMFLYPILDMMSEFRLMPFKNRLPWNYYMVQYHFTIAKTFINFSFGVYVLFAISQMVAIVYPHYYRRNFTLRKIKIMLIICFFYYFAWHIPSIWWFELLELKNICGHDPKFIIYALTFAPYKSKTERVGWIVLGILIEIFTRFLPVGVILVLNYFSLKHKRLAMEWRLKHHVVNLEETTVSNINIAVELPEFEKIRGPIFTETDSKEERIKSNFEATEEHKLENNSVANTKSSYLEDRSKIAPYLKLITDIGNIDGIISKSTFKANSSKIRRKIRQRKLEYRISIRMLAILMVQFVVFLFPVSIYIITVEFFEHLTAGESDMYLAGCTLLEYTYISLTFYLNVIFNPPYREAFYKVLEKSVLGKFYKKHKLKLGKWSNKIQGR
ncbi:unnamed protein product [Gordionus sp. m RMFG-2023]